MQAPPGVDSDTSGEDVSSVKDTSPKQKPYRRFNWRHLYVPPDPPTSSSADEMGSGEKARKKGAKDVMKKTVKFLMEGPDMTEPVKGKTGTKEEDRGGTDADTEGDEQGATPTQTGAEAKKGKAPANPTSQAMLAMLGSLVAQDMVEKRDPNQPVKVDPYRSPLGVPLPRKKGRNNTTSDPNAASAPTSPATPASETAAGSQPHSPMLNPFSVPTSQVSPNGPGQMQVPFYGYGWPPYHAMMQAPGQNGSGHSQNGYLPPPFYPHPAMLQPFHPGQSGHPQTAAKDGEILGPSIGQGYLPPRLVSQLDALHLSGMQRPGPSPQQPARREDAPVRISHSRKGRRREESPSSASSGQAGRSGRSRKSDATQGAPSGEVARTADTPPPVPEKPRSDKQWTKVLICLATSLDILWRLYQAHRDKHDDDSLGTICKAFAKQISSKRSMSQAVIEVFGDESAGKELSKNLKMSVSYIVRSEMLKREPEKLQALIVGLLPKSESSLGSWLNPKIAQVVVITVQKWIDKQLDVGSAPHATRQVRDEARRSLVPEGAGTGMLDHAQEEAREPISRPAPPTPPKTASTSSKSRPHAGDSTTRLRSVSSRASPEQISTPSEDSPSASRSGTVETKGPPKPLHPSGSKPQPAGLTRMTSHGVIEPVHGDLPRRTAAIQAPAPVLRPVRKPIPAPVTVPVATPASPASMSSESRYSTSPSTAPLDSPGTVESDTEADALLSVADSGPAAVHVDRGTELLEQEEEEREKRRAARHKPSKAEVKEAKELLAEK